MSLLTAWGLAFEGRFQLNLFYDSMTVVFMFSFLGVGRSMLCKGHNSQKHH